MTEITKVGLIGFGRIAQRVHLPALRTLPEVHVVALAESDPERCQEAERALPQAHFFSDYRALLAESEAEAVVICLPSSLHAEAALAAFEAGKHVYLEKPIATCLSDAQAVLEAWQRAGTIGMTGFNFRFNPLHLKAKAHLRAGRLGELVGVRTVFSSAARTLPAWKERRQSGGGALLDLASHHMDLVPFLLGEEVVAVAAEARSQRSEEDSVAVQLRLASGLLVQSFFSITSVDEDRLEIYGRQGKLILDRYAGTLCAREPEAVYSRLGKLREEARALVEGLRRVARTPGEPSFQAALGAFVAAAQSGASVRPDLEDGYRSLAILDAAERSAAAGKTVTL